MVGTGPANIEHIHYRVVHLKALDCASSAALAQLHTPLQRLPYKCRLLLLLVVVDSSRVHVDGYSTLQLQAGLQSSKGCQPLQSSAADGGHQPRHHQRRSQTPWTTTKLETPQRTTLPARPPGQPPQVRDLRIKNLVTDSGSNSRSKTPGGTPPGQPPQTARRPHQVTDPRNST